MKESELIKKKLTFQLILSYGNSDSRECGIVTEKKKIMELGTQLVGMYNTSLCVCVVCKQNVQWFISGTLKYL